MFKEEPLPWQHLPWQKLVCVDQNIPFQISGAGRTIVLPWLGQCRMNNCIRAKSVPKLPLVQVFNSS